MSNFTSEQCPQCGGRLPESGDQVICPYCDSRLIRSTPAAQPGARQEPSQIVKGLHLKPYVCMDAQGFGMEAFRLLIPSGWEFQGGVYWPMANPGMPGVIGFQVRNPGGEEALEIFPSQPFFWTNAPMSLMPFPRGSFYYGNEVQPPPPQGALQALVEIAVPRFRGQAGPVEFLHQERLPDLPRQLQSLGGQALPAGAQSDGAKVRFRYRIGDNVIEEELFGVVQLFRTSMPMMMGMVENIFWTLEFLFSFRALEDRLDALADLFKTMLFSFRLNPQWYAGYMQLSQSMIQGQIQHIHQIGQLSRQISQNNNQISDMLMESYNQRQATMDRLATNFSQAIRGVDEYYNPFEERGVELPGGYTQAWANSLGEYIVSEDPNFNPNLGSNSNWQPLQKKG